MQENQKSVNAWQRETFGPQTNHFAIADKLLHELWELHAKMQKNAPRHEIAEELADVQIVLWQLAGAYNIDLADAVARKMHINRYERAWNVRGDGTAQHVGD